MTAVVYTIAPIFVIIFLGAVLRATGFLDRSIIEPVNRLVFYAAIPAMIFSKLAVTPFHHLFEPRLLVLTMLPFVLIALLALAIGRLAGLSGGRLATVAQSSHHANIGYVGLAVAYYYLGDSGLTTASFLAGFLFLLQNGMSIALLALLGDRRGHGLLPSLAKVLANPVIISATAGILFSLTGLPLPQVAQRSLDIMAGMSLPLALLIIGASLSFTQIRHNLALASLICLLKLIIMPGLTLAGYAFFGLSTAEFLPGLIVVAMPSATVGFVLAQQMGGDRDLAASAISLSTLVSAVSITAWLMILK